MRIQSRRLFGRRLGKVAGAKLPSADLDRVIHERVRLAIVSALAVHESMTFNDLKLRKKVWEKEFTNWGDYPSGGGLTQRQEGIQAAVRKMTEDILNDTVAGW